MSREDHESKRSAPQHFDDKVAAPGPSQGVD
jgi:hypothetical protein